MPKISILMNCLNGEAYLQQALDSIYAQTFHDWEIIFVDNASQDKSADIAKSYDERLKYYNTQETLPLYAARNWGLQYVTGQFLCFLDVDDSWTPTKLQTQLTIVQKYTDVYFVCSGFMRKNEQLASVSSHVGKRSHFLTFHQTLDTYPVNLSTVMLRYDSESKKKIRFEPTLNLTGDYELFVKLIHAYPAYYIAQALTISRVHASNLSARLVADWPRELEETHSRFRRELVLTEQEKTLIDKCYVKACGIAFLIRKDYARSRQVTKKYLFKNTKISLIYLATFNHKLATWLLRMRSL